MEANEKQHITDGAKLTATKTTAPPHRCTLVLHTWSHLIPETVLGEGNDRFHSSVVREFK